MVSDNASRIFIKNIKNELSLILTSDNLLILLCCLAISATDVVSDVAQVDLGDDKV